MENDRRPTENEQPIEYTEELDNKLLTLDRLLRIRQATTVYFDENPDMQALVIKPPEDDYTYPDDEADVDGEQKKAPLLITRKHIDILNRTAWGVMGEILDEYPEAREIALDIAKSWEEGGSYETVFNFPAPDEDVQKKIDQSG